MEEKALRSLMADMSLEEKIGQLVQLPGYFQQEGTVTGPAADMGLGQDELRLAGSYLSVIGAETIRGLQAAFMEAHPHHIPLLFMADIINGYRTVFPIPLAQACTFDPALVQEGARVAAREAACAGVHVTFSPMADLVRDARWGRVMESGGEDPFLSGEMAAAMVRGYQGGDLKAGDTLAACLKHFAGYGAPEGGRDYNTVELSPRTLREDYLPAYRAAVDAGCELVMTSFNTLDRIPSAANEWLIREVLRREMGFEGMVISDWNALEELIRHGIADGPEQAAFLALRAGVDMDMTSPVYARHLRGLVESGRVPEEWVDESCWRVLTLKNRLGLFENPFRGADAEAEKKVILSREHREAAERCAEASFVLLRNEGEILPIRGPEAVFIGPYVDSRLLSGAWSIFSDDADTRTLAEALKACPETATAATARGCSIQDPDQVVQGFRGPVEREAFDEEAELRNAVRLAAGAEKVVLFLGEHRECTGEAASRGEIALPACQLRLLREVARVNPHVICVIFSGRPLDLREVSEKAEAVLMAWLPGTEGARALLRILLGQASPSGRLSMSLPYCVGQLPLHYNHLRTGRPFRGDFRAGRFGSKYQDIPNEPLYPFGSGLGYTSFAYSPVCLSRASMRRGEALEASVKVRNTGRREGTETVQLYLQDMAGSVARPVRTLKGFTRVTLGPGEEKEVAFTVTEDMLRFWNLDMEYASEPGAFTVYIGHDSTTENGAAFELKE